MAKPPLLAKPNEDEVLYLYLTISDKAISAVLVKEEERIQKPVYYVTKLCMEPNLTILLSRNLFWP